MNTKPRTYAATRTGLAPRHNRNNRRQFIQTNPTVPACLATFTCAASVPLLGLAFGREQVLPPEAWLAPAGIMTVAILYVILRARHRRIAGTAVRGLRSYVVIGIIAGALSIGGALATERMLDQKGNVAGQSHGDAMESEPDQANDGLDVQPVVLAAVESETVLREISDATPAPEAQLSNVPVVLPPGTRLYTKRLSEGFQVRLELTDGTFKQGLVATDFSLWTNGGQAVPFDVVEVPGRSIAVESDVVIVIDESLQQEQFRGDVQAAVDTVLTATGHSSHKLVSGGSLIRTHLAWVGNADNIRTKVSEIPYSTGTSLAAAVSLNLSELRRRSAKRRILVFIENPRRRSVLSGGTSSIRHHLRDGDVQLVTIGSQLTDRDRGMFSAVINLNDNAEIDQRLRMLTTKREPPCFQIRVPATVATPIRLTVGSGDTALTEVIH